VPGFSHEGLDFVTAVTREEARMAKLRFSECVGLISSTAVAHYAYARND
jgi:hypothetical protein